MKHAGERASPLRGRYLVRNRAWNAWLRINDKWLERHASPVAPMPATPRRVLVAVGGHLGDAMIATGSISALRSAQPDVEVGVLTGSWNNPVFAQHPGIRWLHNADHWKQNRSSAILPARWITSATSAARALRDIREVGYDTALDLSPYYPNASRVLWDARIPVRVGFVSGGGGPLYTHRLEWTPGRHITEDHATLLGVIIPDLATRDVRFQFELAAARAGAREQLTRKFSDAGIDLANYVVVHAGAGISRKEWHPSAWTTVIRALQSDGVDVVLTGAGRRQLDTARQIERETGAHNFCDRLDWDEFRCAIDSARLVMCVDTVAMHLAAAADTPCVALMTGMDDPTRWQPKHGRTTTLMRPVACAPCYRSRGCAAMSCVRDVSPDDVTAAARRSLSALSMHPVQS